MQHRPPTHFATPGITFLGPQDGPPERRLQLAVAELLRRDVTVASAFLARVRYDDRDDSVVLALLTDGDADDEALVARIGAVFASIFNAQAHLDMIFLNGEQLAAIQPVCPPFYRRQP